MADVAIPISITETAQRLAGVPVSDIRAAGAGANSRLFHVETAKGPLALKSYPVRTNDTRSRADVEWRTLKFLRAHGLEAVPEPLAYDPQGPFLLMEWIEGVPVSATRQGDVEDAAAFIAKIFSLSADSEAAGFPPASEACLSAAVISQQIEGRLEPLNADPEVTIWLESSFLSVLEQARDVLSVELANPEPLPFQQRRLVPADFGFHNAIRQPDGRLRYFDFDYFGWDDPVKLTADILLHPAMSLMPDEAEGFVARIAAALPQDVDFLGRLNRHLPLYALRWALIVLNPFRRDRLEQLPTTEAGRAGLRQSRLRTANSLLKRIETLPRYAS